jgi:hypothetical protein
MKWTFLNKHVQYHLKPACTVVVKAWLVLVPICHVPYLWKRDARNLKGLSHMANFKCEVVRWVEENENRKATAILGIDESNAQMWWKHKAVISECEASQKKFTGPKKGLFPETDDAIFTFFQETEDWKQLYCIILMTHTVAISLFQNPAFNHESNWHVAF